MSSGCSLFQTKIPIKKTNPVAQTLSPKSESSPVASLTPQTQNLAPVFSPLPEDPSVNFPLFYIYYNQNLFSGAGSSELSAILGEYVLFAKSQGYRVLLKSLPSTLTSGQALVGIQQSALDLRKLIKADFLQSKGKMIGALLLGEIPRLSASYDTSTIQTDLFFEDLHTPIEVSQNLPKIEDMNFSQTDIWISRIDMPSLANLSPILQQFNQSRSLWIAHYFLRLLSYYERQNNFGVEKIIYHSYNPSVINLGGLASLFLGVPYIAQTDFPPPKPDSENPSVILDFQNFGDALSKPTNLYSTLKLFSNTDLNSALGSVAFPPPALSPIFIATVQPDSSNDENLNSDWIKNLILAPGGTLSGLLYPVQSMHPLALLSPIAQRYFNALKEGRLAGSAYKTLIDASIEDCKKDLDLCKASQFYRLSLWGDPLLHYRTSVNKNFKRTSPTWSGLTPAGASLITPVNPVSPINPVAQTHWCNDLNFSNLGINPISGCKPDYVSVCRAWINPSADFGDDDLSNNKIVCSKTNADGTLTLLGELALSDLLAVNICQLSMSTTDFKQFVRPSTDVNVLSCTKDPTTKLCANSKAPQTLKITSKNGYCAKYGNNSNPYSGSDDVFKDPNADDFKTGFAAANKKIISRLKGSSTYSQITEKSSCLSTVYSPWSYNSNGECVSWSSFCQSIGSTRPYRSKMSQLITDSNGMHFNWPDSPAGSSATLPLYTTASDGTKLRVPLELFVCMSGLETSEWDCYYKNSPDQTEKYIWNAQTKACEYTGDHTLEVTYLDQVIGNECTSGSYKSSCAVSPGNPPSTGSCTHGTFSEVSKEYGCTAGTSGVNAIQYLFDQKTQHTQSCINFCKKNVTQPSSVIKFRTSTQSPHQCTAGLSRSPGALFFAPNIVSLFKNSFIGFIKKWVDEGTAGTYALNDANFDDPSLIKKELQSSWLGDQYCSDIKSTYVTGPSGGPTYDALGMLTAVCANRNLQGGDINAVAGHYRCKDSSGNLPATSSPLSADFCKEFVQATSSAYIIQGRKNILAEFGLTGSTDGVCTWGDPKSASPSYVFKKPLQAQDQAPSSDAVAAWACKKTNPQLGGGFVGGAFKCDDLNVTSNNCANGGTQNGVTHTQFSSADQINGACQAYMTNSCMTNAKPANIDASHPCASAWTNWPNFADSGTCHEVSSISPAATQTTAWGNCPTVTNPVVPPPTNTGGGTPTTKTKITYLELAQKFHMSGLPDGASGHVEGPLVGSTVDDFFELWLPAPGNGFLASTFPNGPFYYYLDDKLTDNGFTPQAFKDPCNGAGGASACRWFHYSYLKACEWAAANNYCIDKSQPTPSNASACTGTILCP